jgi:hypothetical protein
VLTNDHLVALSPGKGLGKPFALQLATMNGPDRACIIIATWLLTGRILIGLLTLVVRNPVRPLLVVHAEDRTAEGPTSTLAPPFFNL